MNGHVRRHAVTGVLVAALAGTGCATTSTTIGRTPRPSPFPTAATAAWAEPSAGPGPVAPPALEAVLQTALALQGVPYRNGGEDPSSGFDCSGFVQYVFSQHSVELPRTVDEQYRSGVRVPLSDVRRGDLIFFTTSAPGATHVGLAIGDGEFVHAPSEKGVVRIDHLDTPYWHDRFVGARRVQ